MFALQPNERDDDAVNVPDMATEIEHLDLSNIVVSSTALPVYDHVPLESDVENESVDVVYVCSPGIGVFLVPAIDVETGSEVSPETSAPETFGVTANEYVAPSVSPVNARLRAVLPTFRVSGATGASTPVTAKSSRSIFPAD